MDQVIWLLTWAVILLGTDPAAAIACAGRAVQNYSVAAPSTETRATGKVVTLKRTKQAEPSYPAGFRKVWGTDADFLRVFESSWKDNTGTEMNASQIEYTNLVIIPETKAVAFSAYCMPGSDVRAIGSSIEKHFVSNTGRYNEALLQRSDAQQLERMAVFFHEDTEVEIAAAPAER